MPMIQFRGKDVRVSWQDYLETRALRSFPYRHGMLTSSRFVSDQWRKAHSPIGKVAPDYETPWVKMSQRRWRYRIIMNVQKRRYPVLYKFINWIS